LAAVAAIHQPALDVAPSEPVWSPIRELPEVPEKVGRNRLARLDLGCDHAIARFDQQVHLEALSVSKEEQRISQTFVYAPLQNL